MLRLFIMLGVLLGVFLEGLPFLSPLMAQETVVCTHQQVCQLIHSVLSPKTSYSVELGVEIKGDQHHYSPSVKDLKKLLGAPLLITAPEDLQPWVGQVLKKRKVQKSQKEKTLELSLGHSFLLPVVEHYKTNSTLPLHALAHFWLYPDIYCAFRQQLAQFLKTQGALIQDQSSCPQEKYLEKFAQLKEPLSQMAFVITHDALVPLLERSGLKVLALKSSEAHAEVTADKLKRLEDLVNKHEQNQTQIVWIIEESIKRPHNLEKKYQKKGQVVLSLNTEGRELVQSPKEAAQTPDGGEFPVLDELYQKLSALKGSRP